MDHITLLRGIVAGHLNVSENEVIAEASFRHDLGADDLDVVELAMKVEDAKNIRLTDDEVEVAIGDGTFGALCDLVSAKLGAVAHG